MKKKLLLSIILSGVYTILPAQKNIADSTIQFATFSVVYSANMPGGNFADRFGWNSLIGGEAGVKFKSNFYFHIGGQYMFGARVKELVASNVLIQVENENTGNIRTYAPTAQGGLADVLFTQAGFVIPLSVGKIFPVFKKQNPNSGLYAEVGMQFIQHKIRIDIDGGDVPALSKDFLSGYDRLTSGLGIKQGLGYKYISKSRLINFYIGLELSQNFTQSRRSLNYDTGLRDETRRVDILSGIKLGWTLPLYQQAGGRVYY